MHPSATYGPADPESIPEVSVGKVGRLAFGAILTHIGRVGLVPRAAIAVVHTGSSDVFSTAAVTLGLLEVGISAVIGDRWSLGVSYTSSPWGPSAFETSSSVLVSGAVMLYRRR